MLGSNNLGEVTDSVAARLALGMGANASGTSNLPVAGVPGNFASLEQIKTDTIPATATTLTCLNPSGAYPDNHWYSGTLAGNVTYPLAATNCVDNAVISVTAVQDAAHTVGFSTTATGGIEGSTCPALGTTAGNQATWQFQWNAARSSWVERCGGTVPKTAPATNVTIITDGMSPYSPTASDQVILCNGSASNITINLPVAGQTLRRAFQLANISASKTCIVHPDATFPDTLDGVAAQVTLTVGQSMWLVESGANAWRRLSKVQLGGDLSGVPNNAVVGSIGGVPVPMGGANPVDVQLLTSGTTYTPLPGTTALEVDEFGAGGPGGLRQAEDL
jgi:hypothetical protein